MTLFSKRLKEAMQLKNVRAADLVKKTNISKGAISSYLSGNYTPKVNNIVLLANALGVEPDWLSGIEKEEKNIFFKLQKSYSNIEQGRIILFNKKNHLVFLKKYELTEKKLKEFILFMKLDKFEHNLYMIKTKEETILNNIKKLSRNIINEKMTLEQIDKQYTKYQREYSKLKSNVVKIEEQFEEIYKDYMKIEQINDKKCE